MWSPADVHRFGRRRHEPDGGEREGNADPRQQRQALAGHEADRDRHQWAPTAESGATDAHASVCEATVEKRRADAGANAREGALAQSAAVGRDPPSSAGPPMMTSAVICVTIATAQTDVRRDATPPRKSERP